LGGGDECVPQRVRPDLLGQPGPAGDTADDPPGAVPVQPLSSGGGEDASFAALADGRSIARAVRGAGPAVTLLAAEGARARLAGWE